MKTKKFNITVRFEENHFTVPVLVKKESGETSICARIDGQEIHFAPDFHDELRPASMEFNLDPELLYRVGAAISRQLQEDNDD